ncbi:MAG TPA: molybdopterin-dependent oxidoreductase [Pyrinomonadaceae bacterium]|nr:molybdopterin-dependent oxidoreductase [Pyrinomonadaceae bacterium]
MSEREGNKLEETSVAPPAAGDVDGHARRAHVVETDAERAATAVDAAARREMSRRSRRSFLALGIAAAGGLAGWRWLQSSADADGIHATLRAAHEFNARLSEAYFSHARLAPTFARELAREPRVNGRDGLPEDFDASLWRLQVIGLADASGYPQYREDVAYETTKAAGRKGESGEQSGDAGAVNDSKEVEGGAAEGGAGEGGMSSKSAGDFEEHKEPGLLLTLDDIRALPRVEITTELKCIEGWSTIVNWAGARFSDFAARYTPPTREGGGTPDVRERPQELVRYVGLETPDGGYYVGMDMPSALHPQTLLCYEMNGQPLTPQHGAPLRLVAPVKYGIKHIKRIGRITFTDERPGDFWAERGYDWYSGH